MAKFKIGDKVYVNGGYYVGTIVDVDIISQPLPVYKIELDKTKEVLTYYEPAVKKVIDVADMFRYGKILTDDEFVEHGIVYRPIRIRTISYDNRIFYHKMVNGEVVEFKELTV